MKTTSDVDMADSRTDDRAAEADGGRRKTLRKRVLFVVKLLVSAALLAYLFHLVDVGALLDRFRTVDLRYVGLAAVILVLQYVISTFKWQLILKSDGIVMSFWFLLRTYLIGIFVSLFLPTSFGGDVYRVLAARGVNRDLARSTSSVLFDRLTGLFALVSIALISYVALPGTRFNLLVLGLYLVGLIGFVAATSVRFVDWLAGLKLGPLGKARKLLRSFNLYSRSPRVLLPALALSFLFQFNIVVVNKLYAVGLGIDVPFALLLVIVPPIYLTEALPISINGLGVRESAFVFFFTLIGQTGEEGLALSLLVISMRYIMGFLGGSVLVGTLLSKRRETAATEGRSQTRAQA